MNKIEKIRQFAQKHLDEVRWIHTQQVAKLAREIAQKEGADLEVVEISAWLHDTGVWGRKNVLMTHQIYSAKYAKELMKKLDYSQKTIDRVCQCIMEHFGPITDKTAEFLKKENATWDDIPRQSTIESKCLYDADMINLCGPMGLVKGLRFNPQKDVQSIIAWQKKLADAAYLDLQTLTGRKLAKPIYQTTQKVFKLLEV